MIKVMSIYLGTDKNFGLTQIVTAASDAETTSPWVETNALISGLRKARLSRSLPWKRDALAWQHQRRRRPDAEHGRRSFSRADERAGGNAEYHLPPTLRRVEMGVVVHISSVRVGHIGDETVRRAFTSPPSSGSQKQSG